MTNRDDAFRASIAAAAASDDVRGEDAGAIKAIAQELAWLELSRLTAKGIQASVRHWSWYTEEAECALDALRRHGEEHA